MSFDWCIKFFGSLENYIKLMFYSGMHKICHKILKLKFYFCKNKMSHLEDINNFCSQPTQKNWGLISDDIQFLIKTVALFCVNTNMGKTDLAKIILNISKLLPESYFLSTKERIFASKNIENVFTGLQRVNGKECINGVNEVLKNFLTLKKFLGMGSFGNVYEACAPKPCVDNQSYKFAIKLAKISQEGIDKPYIKNHSDWIEYFILHDILNPLVKRGISMNLPYLIDTFTCQKCNFTQLKGPVATEQQHPCIIFLTELAQGGTLKDWFERKDLQDDDYYNALFQMMAGIHTIQMHGQIQNNDVKSINTLIYNVKPGGYWIYNILGRDYYIPNRGYIIILNDFGVSNIYSPGYCYKNWPEDIGMNLGNRFAMIINGKYSPFDCTKNYVAYDKKPISLHDVFWGNERRSKGNPCSKIDNIIKKSKGGSSVMVCNDHGNKLKYDCGIKFTLEQIKELTRLGIPRDSSDIGFYKYPHIIPPLNCRGDTQDVIRTFIGGPRYTQYGPHEIPPNINQEIKNLLTPYLFNDVYDKSKNEICSNIVFLTNPAVDLAGYFIQDFFQKHYIKFNIKPTGKLLSTFKI